MKKTVKIIETGRNDFPYNVQLWVSFDGENYYYCGIGKFCCNLQDVITCTSHLLNG